MKIIKFVGENVKKIRLVEITPRGPVVQVTSKKNGQGKSSTLDAIMYALSGGHSLPDQPLRKGADRGRVTLDLGDYIVERVFRRSGTTELTVYDGRGRTQDADYKQCPAYG